MSVDPVDNLRNVIDAISGAIRSEIANDRDLAAKAVRASIENMVQGFQSDLGSMVEKMLRNRQYYKVFRRDMRKLIKDYGNETGRVAWEAGGGDVDEMEGEDLSIISDYIASQQGFVAGFATWLKAKDSDLDLVNGRVVAWGDALRNMAERLKVRAEGDPMLIFDGIDGDESCDDCISYKGEVHRRSWWEKRGLLERNGNPNFECGRWHACDHHYYYYKNGETGEMAVE